MKNVLRPLSYLPAAIVLLTIAANAQTPSATRNSPFAPSPDAAKTAQPDQRQTADLKVPTSNSVPRTTTDTVASSKSPKVAKAEPASRPAAINTSDPTRIYRIGVNDILRIDLNNLPGAPKYLKVRGDGTIDFPLAGENVTAAGKTTDEIEKQITSGLKIMNGASVTVRVREYASHVISVLGLVGQPGEQQIQRDAVPFYVVRAGATIDRRAGRVRITRSSSTRTEEYALADERLGTVKIFPGDTVEFAAGKFDE